MTLRSSPVDDVRQSLMALMAQTTRQWRRVLDQALQPLGLTQATWLALIQISRAPEPIRQKDLAELLALDTSSVVRLLDMLQDAGLIERLEHTDRRAKTLRLTAAGEATVGEVEQVVRGARQRLLRGIPRSEIEIAHGVVFRIARVLEQILATSDAPLP
jgi:MarR family transcriptional regulator, transcriptional regulator for hemolysin